MNRSFLKWAGGKYKLLNRILPHIKDAKRLIEPFAGSCVVSLNSNLKEIIISEKNIDLINVYQFLKKYKYKFLDDCQALFNAENNTHKAYYNLRATFNKSNDPYERSLLFIYLNRHAFNGLCRYNSTLNFNTPFGKYKNPRFPLSEMKHFISVCENMNFINCDFREMMKNAMQGDIIYCDPPYLPISNTSNFTKYNGHSFSLADHEDLALAAKKLAAKGIKVIISNNDLNLTRDLYRDAELEYFYVYRSISCKTQTRDKCKELLAIYKP